MSLVNQDPLANRREWYLEKPLPSSEESERAILGAILLDNAQMSEAVEFLKVEDFYFPLHRRVFGAMAALFIASKPIDPILIGEELKKEGSLDSIGGTTVITNLTFGLPHFANITQYITTVKSKATLRSLVRACNQITNDALSEEYEGEEALELAETTIYALRDRGSVVSAVRMETETVQSIERARKRAESGTTVIGLPSGFTDLDMKLQGFRPTQYVILAARPRIGKTAKVGRILYHAARSADAPSLLFSLEMSKAEISDRVICAEGNIDSYSFRSGYLTDTEWARAEDVRLHLTESAGFYINDSPIITTTTIRAELRRVNNVLRKQGKKIEIFAVDHIGLVRNATDKRGRNREGEVSDISKDLKAIAKEFNCVCLGLSQLNRQPENRADHRPMMSDLRESGSLEQDADVVLLMYREDVYQSDPSLYSNVAEVIIGKNRDGPEATVKLYFTRKSARFSNLTDVVTQPEPIYQPGDIIL